MTASVVVLDYGSGNLRSAVRALERAGAEVTLTADRAVAGEADGLVVPGVGAFAACMAGLRAVRGHEVIGRRLAGGRPVLGICVGMQVLFETGRRARRRDRGLRRVARARRAAAGAGRPAHGLEHRRGPRRDLPVRRHRGRAVLLRALLRRPRLDAGDQRPAPARRWSPGPSTAATGSSRRWRTARSPPPSSTPRSPATRAPRCSATGWTDSDDDAHSRAAARRRHRRRPGRPARPGRRRLREAVRRPGRGRAALAGGRGGVDPPRRPRRGVRPRPQPRAAGARSSAPSTSTSR